MQKITGTVLLRLSAAVVAFRRRGGPRMVGARRRAIRGQRPVGRLFRLAAPRGGLRQGRDRLRRDANRAGDRRDVPVLILDGGGLCAAAGEEVGR